MKKPILINIFISLSLLFLLSCTIPGADEEKMVEHDENLQFQEEQGKPDKPGLVIFPIEVKYSIIKTEAAVKAGKIRVPEEL